MADSIIGFYPYTSQNVSIGASSTQSNAVAANTRQVRLVSDVDCYIAIGGSPTATTSTVFLPASSPEYFQIRGGNAEKVAVIQKSSSGTLNITEMGR